MPSWTSRFVPLATGVLGSVSQFWGRPPGYPTPLSPLPGGVPFFSQRSLS